MELGRNPVGKRQIQPEYGDEQADAGRGCRTRLTRPNSQARMGTGNIFILPVQQLTTSRIGNLTRLILTLPCYNSSDTIRSWTKCKKIELYSVQAHRVFCLYLVVCPCMAINVSVQPFNGAGFLLDMILLLTLMSLPSGKQIKCLMNSFFFVFAAFSMYVPKPNLLTIFPPRVDAQKQ